MADKRIFWSKTGLTGGGATALDSIDGAGLQDGEIAHVFISDILYVYRLDVDSAAAEASPSIIAPATNAGDKRWILQSYYSDLQAMPAGAYELTDDATIAIDWDNGATQYVVLGATGRTVTFANPVNGAVYRFIIIQDGSGSRTITTWPTIKWAGGSAPTLTTTGGKADVVTLLYANSSYYGDCSKVF
jgi:hypothetical protein